jgi:hypothetical protein
MKLVQGKQAFANFIAAAAATTIAFTTTNPAHFVSARIGQSSSTDQPVRRAPTLSSSTSGFTQPLHNTAQQQHRRRSSSSRSASASASPTNPEQRQQYYNRPATKAIEDSLTISVEEVKRQRVQGEEQQQPENRLRNATTTTTATVNITADLDAGVLASTYIAAPSGTPSNANTPSSSIAECKIGYYDYNDALLPPIPAEQFIRAIAGQHDGITFDADTNTITCTADQICSKFTFAYCNLHCAGTSSCAHAWIEDAIQVDCTGVDSCHGTHIDAYQIACTEERACQKANLGAEQFLYTLECTGHESCSWAHVMQVDDVQCTGPAACYGAYLSGVESSVTCQSTGDEFGYYSPTCGGDKGFIEADEDADGITVTCSGDFACIGYGHDPYDEHAGHPIYMDIDVGKHGELVCQNSLGGNHDGGTYVCRYIDIIQGCANYQCWEPKGFNDDDDYRICNHIFSIHHHELCYEGNLNSDIDDDDDDDDNVDAGIDTNTAFLQEQLNLVLEENKRLKATLKKDDDQLPPVQIQNLAVAAVPNTNI